MKQLTTIVMIIMFTLAAANGATLGEEMFVVKLEESGVQFVYSDEGRVTLIKTEATATLIDELVAEKPPGVEVTIVTYANKGNRSPGFELIYEEDIKDEEE